MFEGFRRPTQQPVQQKQRAPKEIGDGCKIKIRNTSKGKTIEFSGNCTKEQIRMAKSNISDTDDYESDD